MSNQNEERQVNWSRVQGHKHRNPYQAGTEKHQQFERQFAQKTVMGRFKGLFKSGREAREQRVMDRVEQMHTAGWHPVQGHKHDNPYQFGSPKHEQFEKEFAQKTVMGRFKGMWRGNREGRQERVKQRVDTFFSTSTPVAGSYESEFYQKKHIIGSTTQEGQLPTIYFQDPRSGKFGHITQQHPTANNVGRELVFERNDYAITNTGDGGRAEEKIGDRVFHPSRNPFVAATTTQQKDQLASAIAGFTNLKDRYRREATFLGVDSLLRDTTRFNQRVHTNLYNNNLNRLDDTRINHNPMPSIRRRSVDDSLSRQMPLPRERKGSL